MEHPLKLTESDSDVYIFKGEDSETDEKPTNYDVVSIASIKHHQLTCLLLNVSPLYQMKKMIIERVPLSTHSPKMKIRIVR